MLSSRRFVRNNKMTTIFFIIRALRRERVFRNRRFPRRFFLEMIDVVDLKPHLLTERSHAIPSQIKVYVYIIEIIMLIKSY